MHTPVSCTRYSAIKQMFFLFVRFEKPQNLTAVVADFGLAHVFRPKIANVSPCPYRRERDDKRIFFPSLAPKQRYVYVCTCSILLCKM